MIGLLWKYIEIRCVILDKNMVSKEKYAEIVN